MTGPASPDAADTLRQRVLREHVASVYFVYNTTFYARTGFILVFGSFLYLQLRQSAVLAFVALHLLLYLYIYFQPRWTPAAPPAESAMWAARITRVVTLLGVSDALAPWLLVPADNLPVTSVLMVMMMGNCARSVQSLRPLKRALIGYTVPMMAGLISALAWDGDGWHLFLAAFATLFLGMILRVGLQEHRQLTATLLLRFENEALAARLSEQVAATERASQEKTRFLATASHDLRQPLHAIALFGAALENALRDRPEGANAERLMRAVNALGSSLDTLLDISRLDAGVVQPVRRPVQLDVLFLQLNHVFSAQAEHRQLQLRLRASGLWVVSDPHLLSRMLCNLIDNALKYTERGGVTVVARLRGDAVWIDVRDTGIGISPEQLDRVFEEFYQVGNQGRDRTRGLGIGLSIVQRLSSLLGHPVEVQSRTGAGARFRIVLSVAGSETGALVGQREPPRIAHVSGALPRRVLVVDDEDDIRTGMIELMRTWGVEAVAVPNGPLAITAWDAAVAAHRPFERLVCDFRLPDGASGLDLGLYLQQRSNPATPLLLITGETAPERLQRVRESGVPVLFKPVDAQALRQALCAASNRKE